MSGSPASSPARPGKEIVAAARAQGAGRFRHRDQDRSGTGSTRIPRPTPPDPDGCWQSHQRGRTWSKSVRPAKGPDRLATPAGLGRPPTRSTRGMTDGLAQWGREADDRQADRIAALRYFQVLGRRSGPARRHLGVPPVPALMEKLERMAVGDRPALGWWRSIGSTGNQLGGADPIYMWLTIPLMYFEPAAVLRATVLRGFHWLRPSPDTGIIAGRPTPGRSGPSPLGPRVDHRRAVQHRGGGARIRRGGSRRWW